jgi:hypothetical protein
MQTYYFVLVLESMSIQYSAPDVHQARVPHLVLGVIITSKYEVLIVWGQCCEIFGEKWLAGCKSLCPGWDIYCCFLKYCEVW